MSKKKHRWPEFERESLDALEHIEEELKPKPSPPPTQSQGEHTMPEEVNEPRTDIPAPNPPTPEPSTDNPAPTPPSPPPDADPILSDIESGIESRIEPGIEPVIESAAVRARAEYDSLPPWAQGMIHEVLNTVEGRAQKALPELHTFFGAK